MEAIQLAGNSCAGLPGKFGGRGLASAYLFTVLVGCTPLTPPAKQPQAQTLRPWPPAASQPAEPENQPDEAALVSHTVESYIQSIDSIEQRVGASAGPSEAGFNSPPQAAPGPPVAFEPSSPGEPVGSRDQPQRGEFGGDVPNNPAAATGAGAKQTRAGSDPRDQAEAEEPLSAGPADEEAVVPGPANVPGARLAPPTLGNVSVRPPPALEAPPAPSNDTQASESAGTGGQAVGSSPQPNSRAVARGAPVTLHTLLEQWPADPPNACFRQQLDLRLLRVLAGDYEGAREPLKLISEEQQALSRQMVESLIAVRGTQGPDLSEAAAEILRELREFESTLEPFSGVQVSALAICREVAGFGQYTPLEPADFPAGRAAEFVLYCEVRDFAARREPDGFYRAQFEMRTVVLNGGGQPVLELRDSEIVDRCRARRRDCFIPRLVSLPATLPAGDYVVKVSIIDKLAEKLSESRTALRVVSGPAEPGR